MQHYKSKVRLRIIGHSSGFLNLRGFVLVADFGETIAEVIEIAASKGGVLFSLKVDGRDARDGNSQSD